MTTCYINIVKIKLSNNELNGIVFRVPVLNGNEMWKVEGSKTLKWQRAISQNVERKSARCPHPRATYGGSRGSRLFAAAVHEKLAAAVPRSLGLLFRGVTPANGPATRTHRLYITRND